MVTCIIMYCVSVCSLPMFEPLVVSSFSALQHTWSFCTAVLCVYTIYTYIFIIYESEAHLMLPCKMAGIFHTNEISVHSIGKKNNESILKRCLQKKEQSRRKIFIIISVLVFIPYVDEQKEKERESWCGRCSIRWCSALRSVSFSSHFFCISLHLIFSVGFYLHTVQNYTIVILSHSFYVSAQNLQFEMKR